MLSEETPRMCCKSVQRIILQVLIVEKAEMIGWAIDEAQMITKLKINYCRLLFTAGQQCNSYRFCCLSFVEKR